MSAVLNPMTWRAVTGILLAAAVAGCNATGAADNSRRPLPRPDSLVYLPITGYNYTNRYIHSFKVDGVGGGNIYVSGPNGGGGGSTCCAVYAKGAGGWKAEVAWQIGACRYNERIQSDGPIFELHKFFKKVTVDVDPQIPPNPHHLAVHFYPDGSVQVSLAELNSPPRLVLSKDRELKGPYPQCPNNEKPVATP